MGHAFKPSPITNGTSDPNRVFDFFSNLPESTHMLTWLFSDYGIPASFRQIPVNAPKNSVKTYNQDGYMSIREQKVDVNFNLQQIFLRL